MTAATITVEKDEAEWADEGWTSTPNRIIRDPSLTEGEKWAWSWFASHTSTFRFDLDDLAADSPRGRNVVREFVRGLERKGLLTRHQERNSSGQIVAVRYKLHPRPVLEERRTYVESTAKKKVMTDEAKDALRRNGRSDPAPDREGPGSTDRAASPENGRSDPAPDRQGAGGPGAGGPGAGRAGLSYKEEKTSREDQEDSSSPATPPRGEGPAESNPEPLRADVEQLCTLLRDRMIGNGCKPPTITKAWRTAARLLLDKDGRELEKALRLINWAADNDFWRANIQSMPTFREQYDKLRLRANTEREQKLKAAAPKSRTTIAIESTDAAFDAWERRQAAQQRAGHPLKAVGA